MTTSKFNYFLSINLKKYNVLHEQTTELGYNFIQNAGLAELSNDSGFVLASQNKDDSPFLSTRSRKKQGNITGFHLDRRVEGNLPQIII